MREQNQYQQQVGQQMDTEELGDEGQKMILPKCMSKKVPIGAQFHQCQIPSLITREELRQNSNYILNIIKSPIGCQVFISSKVSQKIVEEFLDFVEQYYIDKDPDCFSSGALTKEKIIPKALELLHKCNYHLIRAKFSIMFPYYIHYNRLKPEAAIRLSQEEMENKMKKHKQSLRRTRQKDEERWAQDIMQRIQNKVDLHTLGSLIEAGKQNKFDIPQNVKQLIDKANKFGKQLKKLIAQTNKTTIDKLLQKKNQLINQKIITNQMNLFDSTITRCVDWVKKSQQFNEKYFETNMSHDGTSKKLKEGCQKIDFRDLAHLVEQYNSLPLLSDQFQNAKDLYNQTLQVLQKLPQFGKFVKTRNHNVSKITISNLRSLESLINNHPVYCDEFDDFLLTAEDTLQFIENISMLLEDERTQKTVKAMIVYLKQVNDIPIQTNIGKRLQNHIEYINLMQKIKKDILVFSKFQQTQQLIRSAYQKGFASQELAQYQSKLDVFKNWFNTTQKFNNEHVYSKIDIIKKQSDILQDMIDQQFFKQQLIKAKNDLKIDEEQIEEYRIKLDEIQQQKIIVNQLLKQQQPNLNQLLKQVQKCIKKRLKYPQFISLFIQTRKLMIDIADISYLLDQHGFLEQEHLPKMFFTPQQYEDIVASTPGRRKQLKQINKSQMELMIFEAVLKPKDTLQWAMFGKFVQSCKQLEQRAIKYIQTYNRVQSFEGNSQTLYEDVEELQRQLRGLLVNQSLIRQLNEILEILKCRRTIDTKIALEKGEVFSKNEIQFILSMKQNLEVIKQIADVEKLKTTSLKFQSENKQKLQEIINRIGEVVFEKPLKLSQINRIHKEIQKIQLDSIQLKVMKKELSTRYFNCEQWRGNMLSIKNKKKPKQQEKSKQNEIQNKQQQVLIQMQIEDQPQDNSAKQNDTFYFYFKFPLLLIRFYDGLKLKTNLQELSRLRNFICQIGSFIKKADILQNNPKPLANQIADLNAEGGKWNLVFLLEKWKLQQRNEFITCWRNMAISILESMPILRLQQRQILQIPQQGLQQEVINEAIIEQQNQHRIEAGKQNPDATEATGKRKRKQNSYYNNGQITLFVEDLFPQKGKKKKKTQQVPRKKAQPVKRTKKQQTIIQYIEPLEAAYCICRFGLMNQSSIMLQCDTCQRWFHTECVGIRKSYVKTMPCYFCPGCSKRYNFAPDFLKSFNWYSNQKMSQQNFRYLVNQGLQMKVILQQLSLLLTVQGRIDLWKDQVEKTLQQLTQNESKNKSTFTEQTLFDLYLQSLWLPTFHLQSDILMRYLKRFETPERLAVINRKIPSKAI